MKPGMPNLTWLNLEQTAITDAGMTEYLASNPLSLQHLVLSRTSVTQAMLPALHQGAPHIRTLALEGTRVILALFF